MDIITHATTGLLISTAFDDPLAKTACVVGSVLPDVTLAPVYIKAWRSRKTYAGVARLIHDSKGCMPQRFYVAYWLSHSLIPVTVLSVFAYFSGYVALLAFTLGYISHILWDIPTHTQKYACRPFYPFSRQMWNGYGDWWSTRTGMGIMALSWIALGSAYWFAPWMY